MLSLNLVIRLEQPAECRVDPQHRKEIGGDEESADALRIVGAGEARVPPAERREPLEAVRLLPPVEEVGGGDGLFGVADVAMIGLRDDREPIDVGEGEGVEDQRVDDAEDGGVGAETQRERQHDDGARRRALHHRAHRIPQIEDE